MPTSSTKMSLLKMSASIQVCSEYLVYKNTAESIACKTCEIRLIALIKMPTIL